MRNNFQTPLKEKLEKCITTFLCKTNRSRILCKCSKMLLYIFSPTGLIINSEMLTVNGVLRTNITECATSLGFRAGISAKNSFVNSSFGCRNPDEKIISVSTKPGDKLCEKNIKFIQTLMMINYLQTVTRILLFFFKTSSCLICSVKAVTACFEAG